jgi:putative PEP-CTERM system histidine kinase
VAPAPRAPSFLTGVSSAAAFGAPLVAATVALAMVLLVVARGGAFQRSIAPVLISAAVVELGTGLAHAPEADAAFWARVSVIGAGGFSASLMWLGFSISETGTGWPSRLRARALWAFSVAFTVGALLDLYFEAGSEAALILTRVGRSAYVVLLICLVFALAQIEAILRSARDPLRYRIKFVLLGIGAIAASHIYGSSAMLLFGRWPATDPVAEAAATVVSLALVGFGLLRSRLRDAIERVAISPQMVHGSLTVLVVGLYLLAVGAGGALIRISGIAYGGAIREVVVFVAVLALAVGVSSRGARLELRRLVARHFLRSRYDYRTKWREVTDIFEASASEESILDRLLQLLGQTFAARRISVWLRFDADQRYHRIRSVNTEAPSPPLPTSHPVVARLAASDQPLSTDVAYPGAEEFLAATRAALCIPITAGHELIAFIALSAPPRGESYGDDDRDLLRAIARHAAVLLAHARLGEERRAAAELDALHRFSAFCMHDLKNLAARLWLVTQNAAVHGDDPAFREAASRTVEHTAREMSSLIAKLSLRSPVVGQRESIQLDALLAEILRSIDPELTSALSLPAAPLPPVMAVKSEIEQVVLNAVLNARQALDQRGRRLGPEDFGVAVERCRDHVVVTVTDRGAGMDADQLRTLFRPLRTTKAGGLGIGLYESRRLIETNNGRLIVESEPDMGTRVRIELSVAESVVEAPSRPGSRAS